MSSLKNLGSLRRYSVLGFAPALLMMLLFSTETVAACAAVVVSGVDAPRSGASCIWRPWRACAAIPLSELSICGCAPTVSTPSPRSPPACASSSSFSMPCCITKRPGKHLRSPPRPLPFLPSWARFLNTVAASWLFSITKRDRGSCNDCPQYLSITETPTFWKVVISSSTRPASSRGTVSVIIALGLIFFASTICSIEG